jgi:hypothetical protein
MERKPLKTSPGGQGRAPLVLTVPVVVEDTQGRTILKIDDEDGPCLELYSSSGRPLLTVGAFGGGGGGRLIVWGRNGERAAEVRDTGEGGEVVLLNATGKPRASMFADAEGGTLELLDADENSTQVGATAGMVARWREEERREGAA